MLLLDSRGESILAALCARAVSVGNRRVCDESDSGADLLIAKEPILYKRMADDRLPPPSKGVVVARGTMSVSENSDL